MFGKLRNRTCGIREFGYSIIQSSQYMRKLVIILYKLINDKIII